jgi:hypothetical protein
MKEPKNTYLVIPDRAADDGWPEDAGLWPLDGSNSHPSKSSDALVAGVSHPSMWQRIKFHSCATIDRTLRRLAVAQRYPLSADLGE